VRLERGKPGRRPLQEAAQAHEEASQLSMLEE